MSNTIIPRDLSKRDEEFVYLLAKEKVVSKLSGRYIQAMHEKDKEIATLNKKLNKRILVEPKYLTTKDAAAYIGTDPSFLTKRQGKAFKLGEHFFKPKHESIARWDIEALEAWITKNHNDTVIDDKLASLLKRR